MAKEMERQAHLALLIKLEVTAKQHILTDQEIGRQNYHLMAILSQLAIMMTMQ